VQTDLTGAFRFAELPGGVYALALIEGEPLVTGIVLDEDALVTRDVMLPPAPVRLLGHYLLLAPPPEPGAAGHAEARMLLALVSQHVARAAGSISAGYSVTDAANAGRATIVGDNVPPDVEATLRAAECQVSRLSGDGYAVAAGLAQLFAEGVNS